MKFYNPSESKSSRLLYTVLLSVACALFVLLVLGTIYAFARPSNSGPLFRFGNAGKTADRETSAVQANDIRVFSGLGQLRIPLVNSSILILSIAFPYPQADTAFAEELAAKIGDFRAVASGYFSALPEEKLIQLDEDAAKQEILSRLNANLRLGNISELYFSDLMIIDPGN